MCAALNEIPAAAHHVYLRKWRHLLDLLWSITLALSGAHGKFTCLQHALRQTHGRRVPISTAVQDELSAWLQIVQDMSNRLTQLHEIDTSPPTWEGETDAYGTGMGRV